MAGKKKNVEVAPEPKQEGLEAPKKLKLLISIVERVKVDFYMSALEGFEVNMQMVAYAKGTAPTNVLHYLGLTGTDKAVIFSVVREDKVKKILATYEDKYFKTKNGKGIAIVVPVESLIGVNLYQFLANIER